MSNYINDDSRLPVIMFPTTLAVLIAGRVLGLHKKILNKNRLLLLKIITFCILWSSFVIFLMLYHSFSFQEFFGDGLLKRILVVSVISCFYFCVGYDRFPNESELEVNNGTGTK